MWCLYVYVAIFSASVGCIAVVVLPYVCFLIMIPVGYLFDQEYKKLYKYCDWSNQMLLSREWFFEGHFESNKKTAADDIFFGGLIVAIIIIVACLLWPVGAAYLLLRSIRFIIRISKSVVAIAKVAHKHSKSQKGVKPVDTDELKF